MSQRIAILEKELRISLFDRRAGRISLTEAGQGLYEYARRILDLHEQARGSIGGFHPSVSGDLPIAASSVPGECFLPALLSTFHAEHPQVHVRATVSDSSSVIKDVEKGRASLGLIGKKAEKSTLEARPIGRDILVLIVPARHHSSMTCFSIGTPIGDHSKGRGFHPKAIDEAAPLPFSRSDTSELLG